MTSVDRGSSGGGAASGRAIAGGRAAAPVRTAGTGLVDGEVLATFDDGAGRGGSWIVIIRTDVRA